MSKDIFKDKIFNENTHKYHYSNERESLSDDKYIDDNSLLLYESVCQGLFDNDKTEITFLFLKPMEWNSIDYISFLIFIVEKYNLTIKDVKVHMGAIEENYIVDDLEELDEMFKSDPLSILTQKINGEKAIAPMYNGAYQWIQRHKNNKIEIINLFKTFEKQKAKIEDIKKALTYAKIDDCFEEDNPEYKAKEIFSHIIRWITFKIEMNDEQKEKIKKEISAYLILFEKNELKRNSSKTIRDTSVIQAKNIYTYQKHLSLFKDYLQEEYDNFGKRLNIQNIFDAEFIEYEDDIHLNKYDEKEYIEDRFLNKKFLFFHSLFSFARIGLIKIIGIKNSGNWYENSELRYEAKIEIQPKFLNEVSPKNLLFDSEKSIFYIKGNKIKIKKFGDEYHLLRIIFENPEELSQEWFFSDIKERVDRGEDNDKKYYNALYQIKQKLEKIGIKDFCTSTRQSLQINKKYLS